MYWIPISRAGGRLGSVQFNSHLFLSPIGARTLKGGPEPLEKEIHNILGSKMRIGFPTLF